MFLKNNFIYRQILSVLVGILFISSQANAKECFFEAAKKYSVPMEILEAIAKIESNNNQYALNIKGKGYYPKDIHNAIDILNINSSKSFDIGLMQINKWWFNKFNFSYNWGFNKCWNISMGAYILAYEITRANGDLWLAIGRYHSPNKKRQQIYIKKVWDVVKWQN